LYAQSKLIRLLKFRYMVSVLAIVRQEIDMRLTFFDLIGNRI
jgi:hypothetical protein